MKSLVLLSGGIDSAVALALTIQAQPDDLQAIGFDYGQRHVAELKRAAQVAEFYGVPFRVEVIPRTARATDHVVVPGRNILLVGVAVALALGQRFDNVVMGGNQSDRNRFPDCRPEFWQRAGEAIAVAYSVHITVPLLRKSKRQVVTLGEQMGVPLDRTWSCEEPADGQPCGHCLACKARARALP